MTDDDDSCFEEFFIQKDCLEYGFKRKSMLRSELAS